MNLCGKRTIPCLLPQGRGQTFPTSGRFSLQRYIFFTKQRTCGCSFVNVFVKPNEQNRACSSYAMARNRRMKSNVFVKPNEQNRACSSYAMARKRRMKSNVFVKPNEQNRACSSYAMARKRRMKSNVFVKPNEQNRACSRYAMARKGRMKSNVPLGESAFLCYLLHNKLYHNAPKSIKLNKAKSRG